MEKNVPDKQNYLNQLKYENKSLKNVKEIQDKALNEFNKTGNKRQELKNVMEKMDLEEDEFQDYPHKLKISKDNFISIGNRGLRDAYENIKKL